MEAGVHPGARTADRRRKSRGLISRRGDDRRGDGNGMRRVCGWRNNIVVVTRRGGRRWRLRSSRRGRTRRHAPSRGSIFKDPASRFQRALVSEFSRAIDRPWTIQFVGIDVHDFFYNLRVFINLTLHSTFKSNFCYYLGWSDAINKDSRDHLNNFVASEDEISRDRT